MRISKCKLAVLISMLLVSIVVANLINLLSTDATITKESTAKERYLPMTDTNNHLMWFLQISDIHISIFQDPLRISDFKEFCMYTVDAIRPSVVLASGDLTDAKTRDSIGSQQFEKEWKHYRNILNECHIREKTIWLDIRGNHDNFNVAGADSKQNYFANYSMQGRHNPRSYMHQIYKGTEQYTFIGIDACLEPGPRRPFNFIGMLDQIEIDEINRLINRTMLSGSNYTLWFGHFPTSCILSTGNETVRNLIKKDPNGMIYVCGHLHTLGGLIPQMYTLQKGGFLELELGDWKDNRMYRLMAIDHGMFSFLDVSHGKWPIAMVTNPKHALFVNPTKENMENIRGSTHIRILAFSISEVTQVRVKIDNGKWQDCYHSKGPLYLVKWNPRRLFNGLHEIQVQVKDIQGRENIYTQPFVLDETRLSFGVLSRFALMTDASTFFRIMFATMLVLCVVPLLILRTVHKMVDAKKLEKPRFRGNCCKLWLRKFWVLSTIDRIFWPIVLYPLYLSFGPWSVGYLVEDHLGVIFAWGIFVNGAFLPGSFTYAYGFIQLVTFQIPLTFILAHGVDHKFQHRVLNVEKKKTVCGVLALHTPFFFIFGIQVVMAYLFWLAYGTLAFVLGPLRTWSLVLAAILWYNAIHLPERCTKKACEHLQLLQTNRSHENATSK